MTHSAKTLDVAVEDKITSRDVPGAIRVPAASARKLPWRPVLLAGAAIIGLAVAGQLGWNYWTVGRFDVSTDDAYVQADTTVIAPKVSGYLQDVLVTDNQPVKAGQPLARIDDRDYAVAVEQAKADVTAAQADVANVEASLDMQQAVIAQARSTVEVDRANLTFTQQDNDRYSSLARTGAGSVQNEQQAVSKLQIAQSTLQRDTAAVTAAERRMEMLRAQLAKAGAVLAHDRAVQDQAVLNLSYATIVAPVDGVVGNRTLRPGQYVQAGTQLMAVVPVHGVYIVANFKETQLTDVHAGQPVAIDVDTFPGTMVKGHVDSIAPASGQEFALLPPDNATGNFTKIVQRIPVKITLDAGDPLAGRLRPGMSVTPTIDTQAPAGEYHVVAN
ncbi:MAG: HlyD family secretion protein [Acetobacteraceae bacterium]|jgi:membrane fusion protein (multidrug efflux system)